MGEPLLIAFLVGEAAALLILLAWVGEIHTKVGELAERRYHIYPDQSCGYFTTIFNTKEDGPDAG